MELKATAETSPNIAIVKYWGVRSEALNLPYNGSISVTMSGNLRTRTKVAFSPAFKTDACWINGKKTSAGELAEVVRQLDAVREKAGVKLKAVVKAETNFPVGAGLAASSSGFASLTCASARALGLKMSGKELSLLARRVSGSACRSIYGGFVEWKRGAKKDGSDSYSVQLAPKGHWPEFRNVIAVVDEGKKKIPSREGMRRTVATSRLYMKRILEVPRTLAAVREAIMRRDHETLFEAAMRDSDNFHAVLLDSHPKIVYLDKTSQRIIEAVKEFNGGKIKAGYSFDAGPNAHVFTLEKHEREVKKLLGEIKGVKKIIVCSAGDGPRYL